ncbi:MAG: hypothetical protein ABI345_10235 [Jatrophihabitans sp.]
MQQITKPEPLDPDRPLHNDRSHFLPGDQPESEALTSALHESCAYADQLWEALNAMRGYLLDSLPADPRTTDPDTTPATSASPTGPDDELGWTRWTDAFADITSILCGPNGDSGFGRSRAQEEATARRRSLHGAQHADTDGVAEVAHHSQHRLPPAATRVESAEANRAVIHQSRRPSGSAAVALVLAGAVVGGLRPRRSKTADPSV